jgi:hypothetical protein
VTRWSVRGDPGEDLVRRLLLAAGLVALATAARAGGRVETAQFDVPFDGRPRAIQVRTPAASADSANLLIVFDGPQYLDEIPLPAMLDSARGPGQDPPDGRGADR